jgi:hypothetical protein
VQREEERGTFTSFLEDTERDRRERAIEENHRRRGMVSGHRSGDRAGPSNAPPPPSGASGADAAGGDSDEDHLF